jgi:predicted GNAT superfamily acetyltransferase
MHGGDCDRVLALNEASVEHLAPLDAAGFERLLGWSAYARVVEHDGLVVAFTFVLEPGQPYASENYGWFSARYDDFWYLDRIVVDASMRRQGVASVVYGDVEAEAAARGWPVLLEVNLVPPNDGSLAFHAQRGYVEVGRLTSGGATKTVSLQAKSPPDAPRNPEG